MPEKLEVSSLSFSYGNRSVLDGISFTAKRGECLALLGTNGAGKSTLLRCINRLLSPVQGEIMLAGRSLGGLSLAEAARSIAYVPQQVQLAEGCVFDAVLLGLRPHFCGRVKRKELALVDAVLASLGMTQLAMRAVSELSGGERQKVAIARALVGHPQVLLLDEPTASLDLSSAGETVRLLRRIAGKEGITVLAAMHDVNLALRFADRFLLLADSRLYAAGGKEIITAKNIQRVYGISASVVCVNGATVVVPQE